MAQVLIGGRGVQQHSGGAYDGSAQQDIQDGDSLQGPPIALNGAADAINPHVSGNYIVKSGAANAITLGAPTAGPNADDNLSINIWSDTLFAHTVTLPSALFANGAALATVATFKPFRGSGISLRAFNGVWQVLASNVTSIA